MLKENYVSSLELKYNIEYNGLILMSREKKQDMLSKTKTYYRKPRNERVAKLRAQKQKQKGRPGDDLWVTTLANAHDRTSTILKFLKADLKAYVN